MKDIELKMLQSYKKHLKTSARILETNPTEDDLQITYKDLSYVFLALNDDPEVLEDWREYLIIKVENYLIWLEEHIALANLVFFCNNGYFPEDK